MRRRHPQGSLLQHRALWRHHHVPRHRRAPHEGAHGARPRGHEDQGRRAPGAQVLRLDRRLHSRVALDLPADVDLEGRVRRVRPLHRAPQVLLRTRCRFALIVVMRSQFKMLPCNLAAFTRRRVLCVTTWYVVMVAVQLLGARAVCQVVALLCTSSRSGC